MRRFVVMCVCGLVAGVAGAAATEFYVTPRGDDANAGTLEAPFATLARARDAARATRADGATDTPVTVYLRSGRYILDETFVLTPKDSYVTYKAYKSETPIVSGGRIIAGWKKLDHEVPNVSGAAKGNLW